MTALVQLDIEGPAAPPRRNGELIFTEPWESRAFGLVFALVDHGVFGWEEFRQHLIASITTWERDHESGEPWSYYRCWLHALEQLASDRELTSTYEIDERAHSIAHRSDHSH
ncbi:MAG: nitrile hydratase accessory protein [Egibacteraceae bacterium]